MQRASRGAVSRCVRLIGATATLALLFVAPVTAKNQVFLVIADRLTLSDFTQHPPLNIARLARSSAMGLINSTVAGKKSAEGAYISLGAGAGLLGSADILQGYEGSETVEGGLASVVYERRTGVKPPAGAVVNAAIGPLIALNQAKNLTGTPGALGESLKRSQKRVALFGNSDIPEEIRRPAVTAAMDADGIVPEGVVGSWLLKDDPMSPAGRVIDVPLMLRLISDAATRADLVVIDFGDTARLEEYRPQLSDKAYDRYLRESISRMDQLLAGLISLSDSRGAYILLVSPLARENNGEIDRLSPVLLYHGSPSKANESANSHLISSATTRTPGLVSIVDIAPTVLSILQGRPAVKMTGKPIQIVKLRDRMRQMGRLDTVVKLHTHAEWPVLGVMAAIGVVALTPLALIVAFRLRVSRRVRAVLRAVSAAALAMPLALMFGSLYEGSDVVVYAAWLLAATVGIVALSSALAAALRLRDDGLVSALPAVVSLLTVGLIVTDLLSGSRLSGYSLAATFQMRGMRFYGIGNEYMGVAIGCTMMAALWIRSRLPGGSLALPYRLMFGLWLTLVAIVIGLPDFGANVGGAVAAIVAFGLLYRAMCGKRVGFWNTVGFLALSIIVIAVFAVSDWIVRRGVSSHAGATARMVSQDGFSYFWSIVTRKVGLNFQLLGTRQGETALIGFTPFFMLWFAGVQKRVNLLFADRPDLMNGLLAVAIAAVVAFVFNDSGSVAASLLLCAPVVTLLYTLTGERNEVLPDA